MKITRVSIKNFRGIADISFKLDTPTAVIVGPNAMGKTTILQAIRLVRGLLMPVYSGEETQVLQNIGAISQHTQQLNLDSILGDNKQGLQIELTTHLDQFELDLLKQNTQGIASLLVETQLGQRGMNQLNLIQFFSTEQGKQLLSTQMAEVPKRLDAITTQTDLRLTLTMQPNGLIQGHDAFIQAYYSMLSRLRPLNMALVSYFSADRAMPAGEVSIQIGSADAQQEMQGHIATPDVKYQRLKQHIVNQYMADDEVRQSLMSDFSEIFEKLLPGKKLHGIGITNRHLLQVTVNETKTGATYDIDNMSSGEKGLILTFLLAKRRMLPGGLLLLDEPELHLNPAVCRKILPFLIDDVVRPKDLQVILCTHSPEILAAAYDRDDCSLFHLKSSRELNRIHRRDKEEVFDALRRLGTSPADVLFFRGGLHVEGPTDAELLEVGFSSRVGGLKIVRLGGREEVEKEIKALQKAEASGQLETMQCFILDMDGRPTTLKSTKLVKVIQWDRYCFENYLLDADAIYDVSKALKKKKQDAGRSAFEAELKKLALEQLPSIVAKNIYAPREPENAGVRSNDLTTGMYDKIADALITRIENMITKTKGFDASVWKTSFITECAAEHKRLFPEWEAHWQKLANGKIVLEALHRWLEPGIALIEFKKLIVKAMLEHKTDNWKAVDSILSEAIQ